MGLEDNGAPGVDTTFIDAPPASTEVTAPEPREPSGRMSVRDVLARELAERREKGASVGAESEGQEDPLAPTTDEGQDKARSPAPRDAQGRFAPQTKADGEAAAAQQDAEPAPQVAQSQAATMPPPGFSVASKQVWDQLPESVRADIAKREQEIDAGMRRYSGLGKFAEQAEKNGRSLGQVMGSYVALEGELRKDIVGGVGYLCEQLGVEAPALAKALAVKYLGLHPSVINDLVAGRAAEGQPAGQQQPAPAQPVVDPRQIAADVYRHVQAQRERDEADLAISEFASKPEHKFFANVRPIMAALMSSGQAESLKEAYEAACWMNPEIRATLLNEQSRTGARRETVAVDRAKAAAKAVGGAPAGGTNQDIAAPPPKGASIRDVLKHNLALQRGNA